MSTDANAGRYTWLWGRFWRTLLAVFSDVSRRTGTPSSDRVASTSMLTAAGAWTARPVQVRRTRLIAGGADPAITAVAVPVRRTARRVVLAPARLAAVDAVSRRLTSCMQCHNIHSHALGRFVITYMRIRENSKECKPPAWLHDNMHLLASSC